MLSLCLHIEQIPCQSFFLSKIACLEKPLVSVYAELMPTEREHWCICEIANGVYAYQKCDRVDRKRKRRVAKLALTLPLWH